MTSQAYSGYPAGFHTRSPKPKMRRPEKWVGKLVKHLDWETDWYWEHDLCDWCRRFFRFEDLHSLLYPQSPEDWTLQKRLHVEEAMGFCPDCLIELEIRADAVDSDWRRRHWLA